MGYYIQTKYNKLKAAQICAKYAGAELTKQPESFDAIPEGKALICVVDNGPFEAAGYCETQRDFDDFTDPKDPRPKNWVLMNKEDAEKACGVKEAV